MKDSLKVECSPEFSYRIRVQAHHLNYAGHVGHDAIILFLWEARVNMLNSLGFSELNLGDGETGIVMKDLVVNFKKEVFLFDDLTIKSQIRDITDTSFKIYQRILRGDETIATADTIFVAFNYETRRKANLPGQFVEVLASCEGMM